MKFKSQQTIQKLRGGYYTPQNLADFVTKWVLGCHPNAILEPSCGDGAFFQSLDNNHFDKSKKIVGFELLDTEVQKSNELCRKLNFENYIINEGDFLKWANSELNNPRSLFEGIIGNPPFIRYQFLAKPFQAHIEKIFKQLNLKFTKHTNAWVPFVLSCISILKEGGRLGMIIPSEIINVMHSQALRSYLNEVCSKIVIIDPREIWFTETLQGAVILLAQKKNILSEHSYGVAIRSVNGFDFLQQNVETFFNESVAIKGKTIAGKWTKAVLEQNELDLIDKFTHHPLVYPFDDIAKVDVGIVTGANNFFLVDDDTVNKYELHNYVRPMFGRSQHCQGVIYNNHQHMINRSKGLPTNFVYIQEEFENLPQPIQNYIRLGEAQKLHTRYKCRIRHPWYTVPSVFTRKVGMLKRAHQTPRLIFNELEAYTTDTAYRIETKGLLEETLTFCFLNPLTAIFSEMEGRSYGGGVLELVPSEIRKLFIPIPDNITIDLMKLDALVRNQPMTDVLKIQGDYIFNCLGFHQNDIDRLFAIWLKLKNRRHRVDFTPLE